MNIRIIAIASLLIALPVSAQKKKTVVNDSNTPLHLLQPAYQGTYGDFFLEDPVYRISIATQNVAYNQPTQPGFYFGPDLQGTLFRGCKIPKK